MRRRKIFAVLLSLLYIGIGVSTASAISSLYDWAFYVDGATYEFMAGNSMPVSGALDTEGLGTLTWQTSAAGSHTFIAFFDHEIDEALNTWFNEYGEAINTPDMVHSWEIDEPGYVLGDIYCNVLAGSLDNINGVPEATPDDVSWAIEWDFGLSPTDVMATITINLSDTAPLSGFYLAQTDPDSLETIYYSSTLDIQGGGPYPVPEPGTFLLLFLGLAGLTGLKKGVLS